MFPKDVYQCIWQSLITLGHREINQGCTQIILQSWSRGLRQIHKIKQNRFSIECSTAYCFAIYTKAGEDLALGWSAAIIHGKSETNPNFLRS